jgi:hypothetical protein
MTDHVTNDVDVIAYLANVAKEADQHARDMRALADYNAAAARREKDERVHADLALERARHTERRLATQVEQLQLRNDAQRATIEMTDRDRDELAEYRALGAEMGPTRALKAKLDQAEARAARLQARIHELHEQERARTMAGDPVRPPLLRIGIEVQSPHLAGWWRVETVDLNGITELSRIRPGETLDRNHTPILIRVDPTTIELFEAPF